MMLPMPMIGSILLPLISASLEQVHTDLNANAARYNRDLCDLVDIQSISSLKEHQPDLAKAAQWLTVRLKEAGLEVCSSCAGVCRFHGYASVNHLASAPVDQLRCRLSQLSPVKPLMHAECAGAGDREAACRVCRLAPCLRPAHHPDIWPLRCSGPCPAMLPGLNACQSAAQRRSCLCLAVPHAIVLHLPCLQHARCRVSAHSLPRKRQSTLDTVVSP